MPYQPTWNNPYLPINGPSSAIGQSAIPAMQQQLAGGWGQYQQPVNGVVKVNGRDSAMQYQLPPNSMSPALFDNNGKVFYIVSTDGTGMKTVETFDFTPHKDEQPIQIDGAQFVSRKEFDDFAAKVNAVLEASHGLYAAVPTAAGAPVTAIPNGSHDAGQGQDAKGTGGGQPAGGGGSAI